MGKMPAAVAAVFTQPGQTLPNYIGEALVLGTAVDGRYDRYSLKTMGSLGWLFKVKATTVYGPLVGSSSLILFSQPDIAYETDSYWGPFIQLTNFNSQMEFDFNLPPQFQAVASMLLVHTQRSPTEKRYSFAGLLLPLWNTFLSHLPSQTTPVGGPQLGWDAFPEGVQSLNNRKIYLTIYQELKLSFSDFWADYSCAFEYWIKVTQTGGILGAHVQRWRTWVEDGAFSGVVEAILDPNVQLGAVRLNQAFAAVLEGIHVKDVYILPGPQANWPISPGEQNVFENDTRSDATVVVTL